jgi:plexin A
MDCYSVHSVIVLLLSIITVNGDAEAGSNLRIYYLDWPVDEHDYQNNKTCTYRAIPEIFLTGLLSTKGTIKKFVDDYFNAILTANKAVQPAVKWIFGPLNYAAMKQNITESKVAHALKSNKWVTC